MGRAAEKVEELLDEPLWDFLAKSAGVGLSDTVVEIIKGQGWAGTIGDEVVQGIVGLLAVKYGDRLHDQVPNFGKGILYNLVGRVVFKERIAPIFAEQFGKSNATKQALTKAFTQRYKRQPTAQELTIMERALAQRQREAAAPQINLEQKTPIQPETAIVEDWHYVHK